MDVQSSGLEQQPGLQAHHGQEHAASGAELLGVGAPEVAHALNSAPADAQEAAASVKRKLEGDEGAVGDEEHDPKRMRGEDEAAAAAGMPVAMGELAGGPMEGLKQDTDPAMAAAIAAATQAAAAGSGGLVPGQEGDEAAAAAATAAAAQLLQQQGGTMPLPLDPAAAAALGLTAEQQAQMQQLMQFPLLTPEALAAAGATLPTGADGQPLQLALPFMGAAGDQQQQQIAFDPSSLQIPILAPDGSQLTPEQIMQLFSSNAMPFVIPLPTGAQGLPPGMTIGPDGNPVYKNWWDEKDEKELINLVEDPSYRQQKLGCDEVDWDKIATHFGGRSQNALRKKYWSLTKKQASGADSDPDGMELTAVDPNKRPRADRKLWTDEEAHQLMRLVADSLYRAQILHLDEGAGDGEMWDAIAMHFACSVQTAKRKYRHSMEALQNGTLGAEKGKRQHHRKSTPYRWMIVSALSELPNNQGTAPDIFERIEANPSFVEQLDVRIMPGTKHVPRWKIQVRKVLSADKIFQHTGLKQKHETVWRLDQHELQEAQASSRNANRISTGGGSATAAAAATMTAMPAYDPSAVMAAPPPPMPEPAAPMGTSDLTPEQIEAAMQAQAQAQAAAGGMPAASMPAGTATIPPDMAQHMALMHEQIAAAIASAPLVIPPEQLPQVSELGLHAGMQPMDPHLQAALQQMVAQQAAMGAPDGGGGGDVAGAAAAGADPGAMQGGHEHLQAHHQQQHQHQLQHEHQHQLHQHQHQHQHPLEHQHGADMHAPEHESAAAVAGAGGEVAEGQPDPNQQLQHLGMAMGHLDPSILAAMGATAAAGPEHAGAAGLTLPLVHTVEVPAPLDDHQEQHHQQHQQHEQQHHQQHQQHEHQHHMQGQQ